MAGYREVSSTPCLHMTRGLFLRKMGKRLLSDVFSLLAHTRTLGNKLLLLGLPERKGFDWRDISFSASAGGLMFNKKPYGHKLYAMGIKTEIQVPRTMQVVIYLATNVVF